MDGWMDAHGARGGEDGGSLASCVVSSFVGVGILGFLSFSAWTSRAQKDLRI